jgi:hypothetical protein
MSIIKTPSNYKVFLSVFAIGILEKFDLKKSSMPSVFAHFEPEKNLTIGGTIKVKEIQVQIVQEYFLN